jgi:hypothetical protein
VSKKIKKTKVPKTSTSGIKSTKLKPQGISFSFKYYQDGHNKFSCNEKAATYWLTLIDRLKALSGLSKVSDEVLQRRLEARNELLPDDVFHITEEMLYSFIAQFEPPTEEEGFEIVEVKS